MLCPSEQKVARRELGTDTIEAMNQVKCEPRRLIFFSEPEYCRVGLSVYSTHHAHLLAAFLEILLVDTDLVGPH